MTSEYEERFWARVDKNGPTKPHMTTPCHVYLGVRKNRVHDDDYGHFWFDGKSHSAHVVAWQLAHPDGRIPHGLSLCHICDNKPCVRVDHLFVGTRVANAADMMEKGRHRRRRPAPINLRSRQNARAMAPITALQKKRALSINKMCKAAGISPQTWYKWRNGEASPKIELLDRLAEAMGGHFYVGVLLPTTPTAQSLSEAA